MENRFGFKDLVSAALLVVLIVVVLLGMKQRDREWLVLQEVKNQNELQARTLASLNRTLGDIASNGVAIGRSSPTTGPGGAGAGQGDPFKEIKEIEAKPDFARGDWLIDNVKTKVLSEVWPRSVIGHDLAAAIRRHVSQPALISVGKALFEVLFALLEVSGIGWIKLSQLAGNTFCNTAAVVGVEPIMRVAEGMHVTHPGAGSGFQWRTNSTQAATRSSPKR